MSHVTRWQTTVAPLLPVAPGAQISAFVMPSLWTLPAELMTAAAGERAHPIIS